MIACGPRFPEMESLGADDRRVREGSTPSAHAIVGERISTRHLIQLIRKVARCDCYGLAFEAAAGDGPNEYHALEVNLDKPGLETRTRTGYYAQPDQMR